MASDNYFIRVRGRVRGPYDIARLKLLHARGQFSRVHQISSDGQHWVSAASLHDVFLSAPLVVPQLAGAENYQSNTQWYYQQDDKSQGPVSESDLMTMVADGTLTAHDWICQVGATKWSTVDEALPNLKLLKTGNRVWKLLFGIVIFVVLVAVGIFGAIYMAPSQ